MAIAFWGRKSKEYMQEILKLYPAGKLDTVVDACMGSGSFSRNISCQLDGVRRIAFDFDRSLVTMHQVIKNEPDALIQMMIDFRFTEEQYIYYRKITREYDCGSDSYDSLQIAFAELVLLYFSHNSMRGNVPRRFDSYLKYEDKKKYAEAKSRLDRIKTRFALRAPSDIIDLNDKWQQLEIGYDNFMSRTDLWKDAGTWIFIDPPYELYKRGIKEREGKCYKHCGYDVDMTAQDHELFISQLAAMYEEGMLKAKMVICTNYEMDSDGEIIIPEKDRYSKLLDYGFTRVKIENKACSNSHMSTDEDSDVAKNVRRRKMEVVYINYVPALPLA